MCPRILYKIFSHMSLNRTLELQIARIRHEQLQLHASSHKL